MQHHTERGKKGEIKWFKKSGDEAATNTQVNV
jgi:hypothetical protein